MYLRFLNEYQMYKTHMAVTNHTAWCHAKGAVVSWLTQNTLINYFRVLVFLNTLIQIIDQNAQFLNLARQSTYIAHLGDGLRLYIAFSFYIFFKKHSLYSLHL